MDNRKAESTCYLFPQVKKSVAGSVRGSGESKSDIAEMSDFVNVFPKVMDFDHNGHKRY